MRRRRRSTWCWRLGLKKQGRLWRGRQHLAVLGPETFALFLATFAIGTTAFAVVGLLPDIAASLDASISQTDLLVSGSALALLCAAPAIFSRAAENSQPVPGRRSGLQRPSLMELRAI